MSHKIFFNENKNKSFQLIQALSDGLDKRRKYHLTIASCYFLDNRQVKSLFDFLNDLEEMGIRIYAISLYIDVRQVIKSGVDFLIQKVLNEFRYLFHSDEVHFYVINNSSLFHTKALVFLDRSETVGACVIGSSNFSMRGMFANHGNYESMVLIQSVEDIKAFLNSLNEVPNKVELEDYKNIHQYYDVYDPLFQYEILNAGCFVHKWQNTVSRYFSVQYHLTDLGKKQISFGDLEHLGFKVDAETISRQFLNLEIESHQQIIKELKSLLRKYGIETYLGHWVPRVFLEILNAYTMDEYYSELKDSIEIQLQRDGNKFDQAYYQLLKSGFIESKHMIPTEYIYSQLDQLKGNIEQLRRYAFKYEQFELPYGFEQQEKIQELFEDLMMSSEGARRKNETMRRLLDAKRHRDPSLINELYLDI